MTTTERIELARTWLKASRENLWGPSTRWTAWQMIEYYQQQRLLADFLTDMESELWPVEAPEIEPEDQP